MTKKDREAGRAALARAVGIVGSHEKLAALIGCSRPSIGYWLGAAHDGVPAEYLAAIEKATGVTCRELRPDLPVGRAA